MRRNIAGLFMLTGVVFAQAPDAADEVVEELKAAYKSGDEVVIEHAVRGAVKFEDPDVIKQVARGLKHKSLAVRKAAIQTLGRMKRAEALKELHKLYWSDRTLPQQPILFAMLLKEIARHGSKSSIKLLMDSPFRNLTFESGRARLMGMARIRDDESVEQLVKLSRKSGGRQRGSGIESAWRGVFKEDFHAVIVILTGEDYGRGNEDLEKWWRGWRAKKAPRVPVERPQVADEYSRRFERYWSENYYKDAKKAPPAASLQPPLEIQESPTPDHERRAVEHLKEAFKGKDADTIANTIERWGGVVSDKVVHELAHGLRYKDSKVRTNSVIALGWMPNKNALRQLHRMYRREKDLGKKDEALFALLLKSIGRHGDKRSIQVLSDKPLKYLTLESSRARIYGLGNIRHRDSVATLIKAMRLTGSAGPRGPRAFETEQPRAMPELNVALSVLTGVSIGPDQEAWQQWWRDNKRTFKIRPDRPKVPAEIRRNWEGYWNEPY